MWKIEKGVLTGVFTVHRQFVPPPLAPTRHLKNDQFPTSRERLRQDISTQPIRPTKGCNEAPLRSSYTTVRLLTLQHPKNIMPVGTIEGLNANWGIRCQAVMLTFMIAFNGGLGLSAWKSCDGKNGAPHAIPYTTLRGWKDHFDWFGECPASTSKRMLDLYGTEQLRGRKVTTWAVKERIKAIIDEDPSLFLGEIRTQLRADFNKTFSISSIHRCITRDLNYSLKILSMKAKQADFLERATYRKALSSADDPSMFVFVDECSVSAEDGRKRRGRGKRGAPVQKHEIFIGDDQATYTLLGAVDINGFVTNACDVVFRRAANSTNMQRGTIDSERFVQWTVDRLVPTLGNYLLGEPRSVVVLDNVSIHKDPRVLAAIEAAGAIVIWCARYSPDLNPIEMCFFQYKQFLRREGRSFHGIPFFLFHHHALKIVTRQNMINYYAGTDMEGCIDVSSVVAVDSTKKRRRLVAAGIIQTSDKRGRFV